MCPVEVDSALMEHRWERLTFLHWRYDVDEVQRLVPDGLAVETYDGSAWVGLVPFYIRVSLPRTPSVPWASRFCETNVRTYVRDGNGNSGIWFFSLDAERLGAVIAARSTFHLRYFWSQMSLKEEGDRIEYASTRRWPGPRGASTRIALVRGEPFEPDELSLLDHFLTARWNVFSVLGDRYRFARACHPPWPLHRAQVLELDDGLVEAAGLTAPHGEPLVHYSPGVDVRIGPLERTHPAPRHRETS